MKRVATLLAVVVSVAIATPIHAQQAPSGSTPPAPSTAQPGGGMMPMEMCREMMGEQMLHGHMMGRGMMGRGPMDGMMGIPMGAISADPKTMAEMIEMRGEIMKAIGDIMIKHARTLGQTK